MPCNTIRTQAINWAVANQERLAAAAKEVGVDAYIDGQTVVVSQSGYNQMPMAEAENKLRQTYARMTVEVGLRKKGFKRHAMKRTQRGSLKMTVGR